MIVFILGLLDLLAGIVILLLHFHLVGWVIGLIFAAYLVIKGLLFLGDFASIIDIIAALYILFLFLGIPTSLSFVFFAYMLLKFILGTLTIT